MVRGNGADHSAEEQPTVRKSNVERRKEFFDRGVAAYQRVMGTDADVYFCPVCEEAFGRDALAEKQLTLEHVPARALRGRPILLTCLDCQKLGSRQDAQVKNRTRLWDLNEALRGRDGEYTGKATLHFDELNVRADVEIRKGSAKFVPWTKSNNPATFDAAMEYYSAQSKAGNLKFKVTPRIRLDVRLSKVGDLKTAYLAAFAKFGYRYAADLRLAAVRQQIRQPKAQILPPWWIRPNTDGEGFPTLVVLDSPTTALAVHLRTGIVVLPWLGTVPDPYPQLHAATDADGNVQMSGTIVPWPSGMEMLLDFRDSV